MVSNTYLLVILIVLFETINTLPHYRHRRQINPAGNNNPSYDPRAIRENHPSGSIEGTYYYGVYHFHRLINLLFGFYFFCI
jgi:hypothetical protein